MSEETTRSRIIKEILVYMPERLQRISRIVIDELGDEIEGLSEIRVRLGSPLTFVCHGVEVFPGDDRALVTHDDVNRMFNMISANSVHAFEDEIKNGYVTVRGGHRIGMAGKAVLENGRLKTLRRIRSFNIRVTRDCPGAANHLLPHVLGAQNPLSSLIAGPPGSGKTTILRDLIRTFSSGLLGEKYAPLSVGLVDERSEIAGCYDGVPQNDIGARVDILDGCPKAEGMAMLIRSMAPDVLVTDEIGTEAEALAILEALSSGVAVFASAHAFSNESLLRRPVIKRLCAAQAFSRFVFLSSRLGPGTVETILDERGNAVLKGPIGAQTNDFFNHHHKTVRGRDDSNRGRADR